MTEVVDIHKVADLLWEIADEVGHDHIYEIRKKHGIPTCEYVVWNEESDCYVGDCLVGRLLFRLGADPESLADIGDLRFSSVLVQHVLPFSFTEDAQRVLVRVQYAQDHGKTWGAAIRDALHGII